MTTAFDFQGTVLAISASSTVETYTAIGELRSFEIDRNAPEIDVSNADSTFREYLAGLADGGKWTATCNLQANATSSATGQYFALDAYNNPTTFGRYFRIVFDNTTGVDACYKWNGSVLNYNFSGSVDNQWSLQLSGRVNTTSGVFTAST